VLRDSPVRAFTAGSLRIVVAMFRTSLEFKGLKNMEKASPKRSVTRELEPENLLQELGFFLQQRITGNDFVMLA
jgi:hypothetical protein